MKINIALLLLMIANALHAQSPRTTYKRNLVWGTVYAEYKFRPKLTLNFDGQYRIEYTDGDIFSWILRPGLTYKTKQSLLLTGGICYAHLYPEPNGKVPRPEWRPWQEIGRKFESFSGQHIWFPRIRFEQRFIREYEGTQLADQYTLNTYRLRFRLDYTYKLHPEKAKHVFLNVGNEIMFIQKTSGYSAFEQNRAWLAFGYKMNAHVSIAASYIFWYQQRTSATFDELHIFRIALQLQFENKPKVK